MARPWEARNPIFRLEPVESRYLRSGTPTASNVPHLRLGLATFPGGEAIFLVVAHPPAPVEGGRDPLVAVPAELCWQDCLGLIRRYSVPSGLTVILAATLTTAFAFPRPSSLPASETTPAIA